MKKINKHVSMLLFAAAASLSASAQAGTFNFSIVNGLNSPDIDTYITLRESTMTGYAYDFVVTNASTRGTITGVYFEEDWVRKLWGVGVSSGPADYLPASLSPDINGWNGPMGSHTVSTRNEEDQASSNPRDMVIGDGLLPGESQVFSFKTDVNKVKLEDLDALIGTDGYGIAVLVQDLIDQDTTLPAWGLLNGSTIQRVSFTPPAPSAVTSVPTPTALMSAAVLGLASFCRRRRR